MVRSRTCPSPGTGTASSSMRKSDAFGSPTGRETRTTRLADCDMVVSSDVYLIIDLSRHCDKQTLLVPAKAGTLTRCRLVLENLSQRGVQSSTPVVMGP